MSNLFEHCRTEISSASQRYEKPEAMQINLLFAEAKYSRCSQSAISLCQSAAGGGCAGGRRRSDAALCMSGCGLPLFGCGRRANLSKLYFSRPPACGIALQKQPNSHFGKHPAPPIGCLLQGADLPPFVTERWRQKCPQGTSVGIGRRFSLSGHKRLRCFAHPLRALEPPSDLIPPPVQCGDYCALRAMVIIRLRPHMSGLWSSDAMGACLPDQVKTHPLFRIGCAERGAILPVRVPEVVKTIYFLKKRARLFFNSQNYSIFALDFAE